jgi:[pyruvate, water dikinase]-phosphate phosphotransferase / [pyruvate, water dikinase] kinase
MNNEGCMDPNKEQASPHVYIISGAAGTSGALMVNTVLAQFPESEVHIIPVPRVRQIEQLQDIVNQAQQNGGTLVHTMVDRRLRQALVEMARKHNVVEIDLVGQLMDRISVITQETPVDEPGLYRRLHRAYFDRVEAIEYAMNHDDGRDPKRWAEADLLLLGPSRSGKTPLSMYLAVQGWKVANLPIIPDISPPAELFEMDKRRVVGLYIEAGQLLSHRQHRQLHLGTKGSSPYSDPSAIYDEVVHAKKFYRKEDYVIVNVTDKPIEASANEIIRSLTRHFPSLERALSA